MVTFLTLTVQEKNLMAREVKVHRNSEPQWNNADHSLVLINHHWFIFIFYVQIQFLLIFKLFKQYMCKKMNTLLLQSLTPCSRCGIELTSSTAFQLGAALYWSCKNIQWTFPLCLFFPTRQTSDSWSWRRSRWCHRHPSPQWMEMGGASVSALPPGGQLPCQENPFGLWRKIYLSIVSRHWNTYLRHSLFV